LNSSRILLLNIASSCTTCFFVEVMGTDLWRRSVLWLRESPKEYTPAAPLLITTLARSACQTVFGGRNPDKWTAVMRACFADAINAVLVLETSHCAGAGWTIVAAGLECSFNYLQNAAFSSSLLTIRTNRRARSLHHSPQMVSSQRNGRYNNNPTCHGAARFSFLLPHRDAAMIARDSSNSDITAWSSPAREGRTLANGVHGRG
jgi:hypothetical protein